MTKNEFLSALKGKLSALPKRDIDERISFYSEMIDDRIEEGLSEQDAVQAIGMVNEIAAQIIEEVSFQKTINETQKRKKRISAGEITLLCVGSVVWVPLLISALAVIFSLYISYWAVVISLWAVFGSLVITSPATVISGIVIIFTGNVGSGLGLISAGVILAGLTILFYYGCKLLTSFSIQLSKKTFILIKKCFVRKEQKNG